MGLCEFAYKIETKQLKLTSEWKQSDKDLQDNLNVYITHD